MSRSKEELVAAAQAAGIDPEGKSKSELEAALESKAPSELGPVIPEGSSAPELKPTGSPQVGVQPVEASDIPEAGR